MKPPPFGYTRSESLAAALAALARPGAKVLAGGQSLIPLLNMRLAAPDTLVDINGLAELDYVRVVDGSVRVGALVRHARLLTDPAASAQPLLAQATRLVAHATIRNRGTTVGSLVHADPSGELTAVLALLGGSMVLAREGGERAVSASEFFLGPLESCVTAGELAVEARFPVLGPGEGTSFVEVARRHGDYAVCGVAALVRVAAGEIVSARAAYLSVAPTPLVLDLTGAVASGGADAAAALARDAVDPEPDIHASAQYRRHLAGVLTARALRDAAAAAHSARSVHSDFDPGGVVNEAGSRPSRGQSGGAAGGQVDAALTVNGVARAARVPARRLLSDFLRHDLGLTGTHVGCEHGVCGACTVLVDGTPMRSCLLLAASVAGSDVTTVEGLAEPGGGPPACGGVAAEGGLSPVQQAFRDCHGLQCGFCTPGMMTTITAGLRANPDPSEDEAREMIGGNLCRCTGYANIVKAVRRAADLSSNRAAATTRSQDGPDTGGRG